MTTEELMVIRAAMDRLALCAEDEDDATLVESVIARAEAAEAKLIEVERERELAHRARREAQLAEVAAEARVEVLEKVLKRVLPFLDFAAADYEDGESEHSARALASEARAALKEQP